MANVTTVAYSFKNEMCQGIHNFGSIITGTSTNSSDTISGFANTFGLAVGQRVTGPGLTGDVYIGSITATTVTLVNANGVTPVPAAAGSGSGNFLFRDVIKVALFKSGITASTTVYPGATNEGASTNYISGGKEVALDEAAAAEAGLKPAGLAVASSGIPASWDWASAVWDNVTFTAGSGIWQALMYNATKGNKAIQYVQYDAEKTCQDSTFTVSIPDSGTGALRLG